MPFSVWPEEPYEIKFFKKKVPGVYSVNIIKILFMFFGLNGLAIRAPDAKLPPNCTELRRGAFGTSPGVKKIGAGPSAREARALHRIT